MVHRLVKILPVGRLSYSKSLKLQAALANLHHKNPEETNDTLVILEHTPVYTVGIRRKDYLAADVQKLRKTGAEFYETNRGGLITFHGPGQLVVYPIINLKNYKSSMRWYVCHLEKTIIHLCSKFNLNATTSPHTGVWINDNKVCAIGVHGSRFVTTHGLALNCNVDLDWFKNIVPCGIADKGVTSLSRETKRDIDLEHVIPVFLESFSETFQCSYITFPECQKEELLLNS